MRTLPTKLLSAFSDATIGTAIVMVHLVLADRDRVRTMQREAARAHRHISARL
ncbi:MAG TPA: hypothetical protein VL326_25815 [Kofleriaceae bacterium]|jgi:hypothetical protein|nr:hypothetical protein [Kofleriaceae bacterium]